MYIYIYYIILYYIILYYIIFYYIILYYIILYYIILYYIICHVINMHKYHKSPSIISSTNQLDWFWPGDLTTMPTVWGFKVQTDATWSGAGEVLLCHWTSPYSRYPMIPQFLVLSLFYHVLSFWLYSYHKDTMYTNIVVYSIHHSFHLQYCLSPICIIYISM